MGFEMRICPRLISWMIVEEIAGVMYFLNFDHHIIVIDLKGSPTARRARGRVEPEGEGRMKDRVENSAATRKIAIIARVNRQTLELRNNRPMICRLVIYRLGKTRAPHGDSCANVSSLCELPITLSMTTFAVD